MAKKILLLALFFSICHIYSQEPQRTYVPDDNFEQNLIDNGYDDVLDDYVLTENISEITLLDIAEKGIVDLTGLEDFKALESLNCSENFKDGKSIEVLDVSSNENLKELFCSSSLITSLNLNNNSNLEVLWVPFSFLQSIDLSQNTQLKRVDLSTSQISNLDFSNNHLIEDLFINTSTLESINLTNLKNLKLLNINEGAYTSIDLSQNSNLETLYANTNLNLSCIQVQDIAKAEASENWFKRDATSYSEKCFGSDSDGDGVSDDLDLCPSTKAGGIVDANGCEISIADLVIDNIQIGIGSDPCSAEPSCYISLKSLKNIPLNITIDKEGDKVVFEGLLNSTNPIELNDLTEGDYTIVVGNNVFIPIEEYSWHVSFSSSLNQLETTVAITKPDQTYSIGVTGSMRYLVNVNGTITSFEFDTIQEEQLQIPLEVGMNKIQVEGIIECDSSDVADDDVDSEKNTEGLLLFPTLSNGLIKLENNSENQIHGITVTSLNGRTSEYIPVNGNPRELRIDMTGAAKGMYIVRIQRASDKAIVKKILIR